MTTPAEIYAQACKVWAPPPKLKVSEWADSYRRLSSEASSEPGQWRTDRAAYQRGIMDAFNEAGVETVVVMSSAQIGKTEFLLNIVGYHSHQDPAPMLMIQPTLEMAETVSKDRLAPMIRDCPSLTGVFGDVKSRSSGNTLRHKVFPGGHITLAGANSPASLASRPVRVVLFDEVDRYPVSAGAEGDSVSLGRKRAATFWNRKILLTSTPTVKGASRIEYAYEASDQRRYWVPCPHCEEFQVLMWRQVHWDKGKPETAHYACEHCGGVMHERDKHKMLTGGQWRADKPGGKTAGFHISELYSPWRRWEEMVADFLEAKDDSEMLRTFVNTSLGETYEEQGDSVDPSSIMARAYDFGEVIPADVCVLTMGVDVQHDRLELELVGWNADGESWSIDYQAIVGDTSKAAPWQELTQYIEQTWPHASGPLISVSSVCIDSGDQTQTVYDYCASHIGRRLYAIKGVAGEGKPVADLPKKKRTASGRVFHFMTIGTDAAKTAVYQSLSKGEAGPGYCHFPLHRGEEYYFQLTAEQVQTKFRNGFPHRVWVKTRARNEALDCRIYAYAAFKRLPKSSMKPIMSRMERGAGTAASQPRTAPSRPSRPRSSAFQRREL